MDSGGYDFVRRALFKTPNKTTSQDMKNTKRNDE
jgi:hypothetical protein